MSRKIELFATAALLVVACATKRQSGDAPKSNASTPVHDPTLEVQQKQIEANQRLIYSVLPAILFMFSIVLLTWSSLVEPTAPGALEALQRNSGVTASGALTFALSVLAVVATLSVALSVAARATDLSPSDITFASRCVTATAFLASLAILTSFVAIASLRDVGDLSRAILSLAIALVAAALAAGVVDWPGRAQIQLADRVSARRRALRVLAKYDEPARRQRLSVRRMLLRSSAGASLVGATLVLLTAALHGEDLIDSAIASILAGIAGGVSFGVHLLGLLAVLNVEITAPRAEQLFQGGYVSFAEVALTLSFLASVTLPPETVDSSIVIIVGAIAVVAPPLLITTGIWLHRGPAQIVAVLQHRRAESRITQLDSDISRLRLEIATAR